MMDKCPLPLASKFWCSSQITKSAFAFSSKDTNRRASKKRREKVLGGKGNQLGKEEGEGERGKGRGSQETDPGSLGCSVSFHGLCITEQARRRWSVPYARNIFKLPKWHFVLTIEDKIHMQNLLVMIILFIYPNVCNKTMSELHSTLNWNELKELANCLEHVQDFLNALFRLNCSHLPFDSEREFCNGNCQWCRTRHCAEEQRMACRGESPPSAHRGTAGVI